MFGPAKPLAALSSGLLARKGRARPAMRPHGTDDAAPVTDGHDDLGWNDMGAQTMAAAGMPAVLVQRAALTDCVAVASSIPAETVAAIGRHAARAGKASFTLRLDAGRHLRLRIAGAVAGRSSQAILTQALDAFLKTLPLVEELARQLPGQPADRLGD